MTVVLDASALLAYLLQEPGSELVQKSLSAGVEVQGMREELQALGMRLGLTVVTCARAWAELPLELEVQVLR